MTPQTILEAGVAAGAFPGAAAYLARWGHPVFEGAVGYLGVAPSFLRPVSVQTRYDLASLTKIYTLAAALLVLRDAKIGLETPIRRFFPGFDVKITIEGLMTHRSGLYFPIQTLQNIAAAEWIRRIAAAPDQDAPGETVHYSCTNYFLLARLIEQVGSATLNSLIAAAILRPFQLENTTFAPLNLENVAPTEQREPGNPNQFLHGTVHDEAGRSWRAQTGNCAGNAGLFASASDVARFAALWMRDDFLHADDIEATYAVRWPEKSGWRGLGWQFDAPFYMSDLAPPGTAGHLGFTGPSLVTHRESQSVAVILNNRVHPTRLGPDRLVWHRLIARWLFANS